MSKIIDIKYNKIKGDEIYTVILDNEKKYSWNVFYIDHCGWAIMPMFKVEGIQMPRVMIEKRGTEYNWWDDEGKPGKIKELTEEEKMAYCAIKDII